MKQSSEELRNKSEIFALSMILILIFTFYFGVKYILPCEECRQYLLWKISKVENGVRKEETIMLLRDESFNSKKNDDVIVLEIRHPSKEEIKKYKKE